MMSPLWKLKVILRRRLVSVTRQLTIDLGPGHHLASAVTSFYPQPGVANLGGRLEMLIGRKSVLPNCVQGAFTNEHMSFIT